MVTILNSHKFSPARYGASVADAFATTLTAKHSTELPLSVMFKSLTVIMETVMLPVSVEVILINELEASNKRLSLSVVNDVHEIVGLGIP